MDGIGMPRASFLKRVRVCSDALECVLVFQWLIRKIMMAAL